MGRRSTVDWPSVRAKREAGATFKALSAEFGVDQAAICRRAKKEAWLDPVDSQVVIQRRAQEKVNGIDNADPAKKAQAIDIAAVKVADVVQRHRDEWEGHKRLVDSAIDSNDFDAAKLAKITAETLKIRQDGERRAWGLDAKESPADAAQVGVNVQIMPSREELIEEARKRGLPTNIFDNDKSS